jgi:hypothetical protein
VGGAIPSTYLGVERNLHGHAVLLVLTTNHTYPAIYEHVDYDSVGNPTPRVGWPTTSKTKPIMIDALAQTFRERRPWRNAALIGEARVYTVRLAPVSGTHS